ncbi:AP2/ERF domain [Dillenia turbinata]|uniref:AP2/ERF domain n=1 Tax=Dillenia turbinata TaxID=194707 RepID=A0AAN8VSM0_9MAGN
MITSPEEISGTVLGNIEKKYKGIRRRKWGKWVSEIRVPGTQDRLWLGSYSTPEAAAIAHDFAFFCLRGGGSAAAAANASLNFPLLVPATLRTDMSPRSIQRVASDAGMAMDAHLAVTKTKMATDEESGMRRDGVKERNIWEDDHCCWGECWTGTQQDDHGALSISVDDYL